MTGRLLIGGQWVAGAGSESLKDKFTASIKLEGGVIEEIVKDALILSDLLKIEVQSAEKVVIFKASDAVPDRSWVELPPAATTCRL